MYYSDILSDNLILREWLNGSLFPLSGNLAIIIGLFLQTAWVDAKRVGIRFQNVDGVPTACALFWIFAAESVRAASVWYLLRTTNDGKVVSDLMRALSNLSLTVVAGILIITMLRCTALFEPPRFKGFWIYSAISTLLFLIASHLFPQIG